MVKRRASLADKAYRTIRDEIITGALLPNQQIAQRQLAKRHSMGVTPIREALQRLSDEKLVRPIPRFGYIVSPISISDMREMHELRFALEPFGARLAAQRASPNQIEEIIKSAAFPMASSDSSDSGDGSGYRYEDANIRFHSAIALASGNSRLAELVISLLEEQKRLHILTIGRIRLDQEQFHSERLEIVEAIRNHDPNRAEQLVRAHIIASHERDLELTRILGMKNEDV